MRISVLVVSFLALASRADPNILQQVLTRGEGANASNGFLRVDFAPMRFQLNDSFSIQVEARLQQDIRGNYSFDYGYLSSRGRVVDLRQGYLEYSAGDLQWRIGQLVSNRGRNRLINPVDPSPLDFNDAFHPDRMGAYAASVRYRGLSMRLAKTRVLVCQQDGRYQFYPDSMVDSVEHRLGRDYGLDVAYQWEGEQMFFGVGYYRGTGETPHVTFLRSRSLERYPALQSYNVETEAFFGAFTISGEVAVRDFDEGSREVWIATEVQRTFLLGEEGLPVNVTGFYASTVGTDSFLPYDRLRKTSFGAVVAADLVLEQKWQLAGELVHSTTNRDYFGRILLRYRPSSRTAIELYAERGRVTDAVYPRLGAIGLSVTAQLR